MWPVRVGQSMNKGISGDQALMEEKVSTLWVETSCVWYGYIFSGPRGVLPRLVVAFWCSSRAEIL